MQSRKTTNNHMMNNWKLWLALKPRIDHFMVSFQSFHNTLLIRLRAFSQLYFRSFLPPPKARFLKPTPTEGRLRDSAPCESSKGDRGGSESSRLKHDDPLSPRRGMHWGQEVKLWEATSLQEYKNHQWALPSPKTGSQCLFWGEPGFQEGGGPAAFCSVQTL